MTITIAHYNWVDAFDCPYCGEVTMFRASNSYKHNHVFTCTGPWDRSKPGCGFSWVQNADPKLDTHPVNQLHWNYAMALYERKQIYVDTGILVPISIVGDSMIPTLHNGQTYILKVINGEYEEFIDGQMYSIWINNKPNCCRIFDAGNGWHLYKDNRLFSAGTDLWVPYDFIHIVGMVLLDEKKEPNFADINFSRMVPLR